MIWLLEILTTALITFTATNIDDLVILILLFSQVPNRFLTQHIIWGKYLGFAILVMLSLPGFLGGLLLPKPWIGLLGIVPIAVGIRAIKTEDQESDVQTVTTPGFPLLNRQVASVAAITIANGGDNIGIYVSLFASQTWTELGLTLLVFAGLIAVWCTLAHELVKHPVIGYRITHWGHQLVPPILISLGMFILIENETYRLLQR